MEFTTFCWFCIAKVQILLAIANGTPVLCRNLFGSRFAWPLDFGFALADNRPLFGQSKTWRGIISSVMITALTAPVLGIAMNLGAQFGALAMFGDLLSSFCKRRLGLAESSRFRLLDTIPESLFPLVFLRTQLDLTAVEIAVSVIVFVLLEMTMSPLLYRLRIRNRPY